MSQCEEKRQKVAKKVQTPKSEKVFLKSGIIKTRKK